MQPTVLERAPRAPHTAALHYARRKLLKCTHMYIADTGRYGLGLFTARAFRKGEVVMADLDGDYYEQVFSYEQLRAHGLRIEDTLQVGEDAFRLCAGSLDEFTNHSCAPNTGIRLTPRGTIIVALHDIAAHDELTYDYSTYLNNPYESLECRCSAPACRGIIGNFDTLPPELQRRYVDLGVVGDFVLEPRCERRRA